MTPFKKDFETVLPQIVLSLLLRSWRQENLLPSLLNQRIAAPQKYELYATFRDLTQVTFSLTQ